MLVLEYESPDRAGVSRGLSRTARWCSIRPPPVLHYGQAMFEGLKAFRQVDGRVALFRVDDNLRRLATARRACRCRCPTCDVLREAIVSLVSTDSDWVPSVAGTALYSGPC